MKPIHRLVCAIAILALPCAATAGEGKFSALAFGDIYYVAANHDSTLEDMNGLWFRRIYLTYDYKIDDAFSARVRLEAGTPGDFTNRASMITFVKDAYLKYQPGPHALSIGLIPVPALGTIEDLWGYRALEKAPAELQRLLSSRDMGVGVQGTFGEGERIGYHVVAGNGNGVETETNAKKKGMGALWVKPTEHLVLEVYGDYEDRTNDADRTTMYGLVGWQADKFRTGVQYVWQNRNTTGEDTEIAILSAFVTGAVSEKVWLVGRVDRNFDANPDGPKILYLPFSPEAANTFFLAAIDFRVRENISIMPNVETVVYDEPEAGGEAPDTDVMPRLTFAWSF